MARRKRKIILEDTERKKKVPALPIQERDYNRFKYKLEEISKDCPERNLMIFYIGVATGYRLVDYLGLTNGELKEFLDEDKFIIQESKQYNAWKTHIANNPNSKRKPPAPRESIIQTNLRKKIKEYVKGKKNSEYAFESEKYPGEPITPKTYSAILKKVGEECTEVIISCKEDNKEEQINEFADLIYHILVLMVDRNISIKEIEEELIKRSKKINNFKGERKNIEKL